MLVARDLPRLPAARRWSRSAAGCGACPATAWSRASGRCRAPRGDAAVPWAAAALPAGRAAGAAGTPRSAIAARPCAAACWRWLRGAARTRRGVAPRRARLRARTRCARCGRSRHDAPRRVQTANFAAPPGRASVPPGGVAAAGDRRRRLAQAAARRKRLRTRTTAAAVPRGMRHCWQGPADATARRRGTQVRRRPCRCGAS